MRAGTETRGGQGRASDRLGRSSRQPSTEVDRFLMSGPNTSYDPVEVAVLSPQAVAAAVEQALAAIAAAADLDALKRVRLEHDGDASPLALANREIGALPPAARKEAGQRVGQARAGVRKALDERRVELEAERDARVIVEEAVDVTLPADRVPPGARHPLEAITERIADVFVGMGWEVAEGPEVEAEWFNFDALNFDPDHPARQMQDTFFVEPPESRPGAAHAHQPGADPRAARARRRRSTSSAPARCSAPTSSTPRTPPVFHQVEGLAVDKGLTMAHLKGTLDHFARAMFGARRTHPPAPVVLPLHRAQRRARRALLRLRRQGPRLPHVQGHRLDRVGRLRHGPPERAARRRRRPRRSTRASPSAWASSARSCSATASRTCATWSRATSGSACTTAWRCEVRVPLSWLGEYAQLPEGTTGEQVAAALVAVGLEEEALHGGDVRGPLVVGRVLAFTDEPQKNGKTIRWCSVDVGETFNDEGQPRGIVCGAHNFERGRPGRRQPSRGRAARRLRHRRPQDLRPRQRRHDLLGQGARPRRRPRGHHPARRVGRRGAGRRRRHRAPRPRRGDRRGQRHARPRLRPERPGRRARVRAVDRRSLHRPRRPRGAAGGGATGSPSASRTTPHCAAPSAATATSPGSSAG